MTPVQTNFLARRAPLRETYFDKSRPPAPNLLLGEFRNYFSQLEWGLFLNVMTCWQGEHWARGQSINPLLLKSSRDHPAFAPNQSHLDPGVDYSVEVIPKARVVALAVLTKNATGAR